MLAAIGPNEGWAEGGPGMLELEGWRIADEKMPTEDRLDVTGIPYESGILSERELYITDHLAVDIVNKLSNGEWTSEEVTIAFCKRASIAHQLVRLTQAVTASKD